MQKINIIGAGLYGVFLAKIINDKLIHRNKEFKINLFEKSSSILSAWKSREINQLSINNGFHGIEMPRAQKTFELLRNLGCDNSLQKTSNFRLISIDKKLIRFDSQLNDWPRIFHEDFAFFLKELNLNDIQDERNFEKNKKYILNTKIGKLIDKCSKRYGNNLFDSWHLFYPWFFPSEFKTTYEDEGSLFQLSVRSKKIIPYYIEPIKFVFEDLIPTIEKSLLGKNINIEKNHQVDKEFLINLMHNNHFQNINIWSASSFELLRIFDNKKALKLLSNKRYIHLLLFNSDICICEFLSCYERPISEIICIDDDLPGLARISFPKFASVSYINLKNKNILVEYFSKEKELSNDEIEEAKKYLSELFNVQIYFTGSCFGRVVYNLTQKNKLQGKQYLDNLISDFDMKVPNVYWGPINMSKCGIVAQNIDQIIKL